MQTVGIIGGAGFIGSYVTKIFLEENYRVKVSSTNMADTSRYQHLQDLGNSENLSFAACDVRDIAAVGDFVKGCDIVVHAGTPFILDVKDPQTELFDPTVKGTNNFLEVISNTPGIKKIVFIASVAAWNTSFPMAPATYSAGHIFSERDNPYMGEQDHPYAQAKFLADQAVREFTNRHPALGFEITSISPVFVIGNPLSARPDSTSIGLQYLLKHKLAPNPFMEMLYAADVSFAMIDVRDVAEAVFQAATKTGLHGKNYLVSSESYPVSDISLMLNNQQPVAGPAMVYDSGLVKKELGLAFISVRETLKNCL